MDQNKEYRAQDLALYFEKKACMSPRLEYDEKSQIKTEVLQL